MDPITPESIIAPDVVPAPAAAPTGVAQVAQQTTDAGSAPIAGVPAATLAPAPDPITEAPQYFEAIGPDEKPFQIPINARFPWKRGDETGFHTLEQITKSPYLMEDYRRNNEALRAQREDFEAGRQAWAAEQERREIEYEARLEAARADQRRLVEAAAQGGEAYAKELRHQEMLETDPDYRARFEESEEYRIGQRLTEHDRAVERQETIATATSRAQAYIAEQCQKFPGLDPKAIEESYAAALQRGAFQGRIHADDIDQVIQHHRTRAESSIGPIRAEMDGLKQQLAGLQAQLGATAHNAGTQAAIARATGNRPGVPANGNPLAAPTRKPWDPNGPISEQEYSRRWINEGLGA